MSKYHLEHVNLKGETMGLVFVGTDSRGCKVAAEPFGVFSWIENREPNGDKRWTCDLNRNEWWTIRTVRES